MSLRIGAGCAVIDDEGRVLLSKRKDFNFWNLPAGRLDAGESLRAGAAREVREETGVVAHVERAVGLYFWPGRALLSVVFAGWPVGGTLLPATNEARENRYFAPDELPAFPRQIMTLDALAGTRHKPRVLDISWGEQQRLKARLARRWLWNYLRGRRESNYHFFDIQAVAVVWDEAHARVLTTQRGNIDMLPRVVCTGKRPPWDELAAVVAPLVGTSDLGFRWVGLWEDVEAGQIDLIFALAGCKSHHAPPGASWMLALNGGLTGREGQYVARVGSGFATDPVWMTERDGTAKAGDTLLWDKEAGAWS